MEEVKSLRYTCGWRFEDGEYCAYLIDNPKIAGYGNTVKLAVDDLYMELLEETSACEIILDVVSDPNDQSKLYIIDPNEISEVQGKASRLFSGIKCEHCGKFGARNYRETLDLKNVPKTPCSYVAKRSFCVFSRELCEALEKLGIAFTEHHVTALGEATNHFELEPHFFVRVPIPARARVVGSGGWTCSLCGFTSFIMQDIPTELPGCEYVLDKDVPSLEGGFFLKRGSYPPSLVLKGSAIEILKMKGLLNGVGIQEVFAVTESEANFEWRFSDFPVSGK